MVGEPEDEGDQPDGEGAEQPNAETAKPETQKPLKSFALPPSARRATRFSLCRRRRTAASGPSAELDRVAAAQTLNVCTSGARGYPPPSTPFIAPFVSCA